MANASRHPLIYAETQARKKRYCCVSTPWRVRTQATASQCSEASIAKLFLGHRKNKHPRTSQIYVLHKTRRSKKSERSVHHNAKAAHIDIFIRNILLRQGTFRCKPGIYTLWTSLFDERVGNFHVWKFALPRTELTMAHCETEMRTALYPHATCIRLGCNSCGKAYLVFTAT